MLMMKFLRPKKEVFTILIINYYNCKLLRGMRVEAGMQIHMNKQIIIT